jgi:biotin transport system ATP-binding protein
LEIRFSGASVTFGNRTALQPLTLTLQERRIGVVGLNGSGKTTFAKLINGLVKPTGGYVTVEGLDTVKDAGAVLRKVGFIFQNPQQQLIMPILKDDIAFGLKAHGVAKEDVAARTTAILSRFGIAHLADRRVHELSGGETQLAAIAGVTVTGPGLLIFDEPANQLDLKNRKLVKETIAELDQQAVVISHDLPFIADFDRVLLFHEGRLEADGAPADVIVRYREIAEC